MPSYDHARKEISYRVVYCGPGMAGKTTNLRHLCSGVDRHGQLMSIDTAADRTLFCSLLAPSVARIQGHAVRLHLYTVPGSHTLSQTRRLVLRGADGVVFVASSESSRRQENLAAFGEVQENLRSNGLELDAIPVVFQYNKRDLFDVDSVDVLNRCLNSRGHVWKEGVASLGIGVAETLNLMTSMLMERTLAQDGRPASGSRSSLPVVDATAPRKVASPARRTPGPLSDVPTPNTFGPLRKVATPMGRIPGPLENVPTPVD